MIAAETAITIDDVVTVINSGRLKEKSFDPYTAVSTLQVLQNGRQPTSHILLDTCRMEQQYLQLNVHCTYYKR
jgi:hypothetical protein